MTYQQFLNKQMKRALSLSKEAEAIKILVLELSGLDGAAFFLQLNQELPKDEEEKYLKAIAKTYGQILTQPRTYQGSFWHKDIYPNQVWLDGLYMAMPFYALYETKMNDCKNIQDIINQYKRVYSAVERG